jgi:5-methylcytosine-specific restriction protein A
LTASWTEQDNLNRPEHQIEIWWSTVWIAKHYATADREEAGVGFADIESKAAILQAVEEFDRIGRPAFLANYHFGEARRYFLVHNGQLYDSKAIIGAAHQYVFPEQGPLGPGDFSGGEATVKRKLEALGFAVVALGHGPGGGRNPPWERDELILALDLYVRDGLVDDTDPRVIELSELLNRLPLHPLHPDPGRFRNPNGVHLKLANFAALDPAYPGTGMQHGGQLDRAVWDEFHHDHGRLATLASAIRAEAAAQQAVPLAPEDGEDEAEEGRILFRRHRVRERDPRFAKRKKQAVRDQTGRLACEVCAFDFEVVYGSHGAGYIEATTPSRSRRPLTRERRSSATSWSCAPTVTACSIEAIPHQRFQRSVK